MAKKILIELHTKYIKGSRKEMVVQLVKIFLCHLTIAVSKDAITRQEKNVPPHKVYVTTRAIKHLYDKKPAEEYDFAIDHIHKVVRYPDHIYENKNSKKGQFIFSKKIKGENWLCSIEQKDDDALEIVTCFRIRKESYLDNYKLLWSWEAGNPPS